jgi:chromate reductase
MITIVSGTNRPGNKTQIFARMFLQLYQDQGIEAQLLDLQNLPADFSSVWMSDRQSPAVLELIEKYFRNADKFHLVIPEYQGTFPGIMKMVFDAVPPRDIRGKKIALTGIGSGRGGNLRGMDHLAAAFHYLGLHVYPVLQPISLINDHMNAEGIVHSEPVLKSMKIQADGFAQY